VVPQSGSADAERLRLLRVVRKQVAALTKPAAQTGFKRDVRELDKAAARLRAEVAAGKVSKSRATPTLRRFARTRREVVRLMKASDTTGKRTLAAIDKEIERISSKG
jgi:hypothetical protein